VRVAAADHLVFAFPIWWESMPALTKGFLDKVLTREFAFRELANAKGDPFVNLLTRLRGVTLLTIMTTPDKAYRWWFRNPVTKILFKGTFDKIGVKNLKWRNYPSVISELTNNARRCSTPPGSTSRSSEAPRGRSRFAPIETLMVDASLRAPVMFLLQVLKIAEKDEPDRMDANELSARLAAIASPQRMRILALLVGEPLHVSELARRVGMSRALLYMHLTKLEEAGFVSGHLTLGDDGKAMKIFEVVPFEITLDAGSVVEAVAQTKTSSTNTESE
jgi:predicted transcriptional regulator